MKHFKKISLLMLSLVIAVMAVTGCGTLTAVEEEKIAQEELADENMAAVQNYTEANFCSILTGTTADSLAAYIAQGQILITPPFDNNFLKRWQAFESRHGAVQEAELIETTLTEDNEYIARILMTGEDGEQMALAVTYDAEVHPLKTVLEDYTDESTISFGQKMGGAAVNIVVGLLTVFLVLIILLLVISSFSLINKATAPKAAPAPEKKAAPAPAPAAKAAPAPAAAPAVDNNALIAVITAAIAASEGKTPEAFTGEGYYVRSIRRKDTNKWR